MKIFAKGKRSLVYKKGEIIIKVERENIQAIERISNEAKWLKDLNKKGIGPKFIKLVGKRLYMEYIEGELIMDFASHAPKKELLSVLLEVLEQCRTLDKTLVTKFEMHRPIKHIIVRKGKPVLIDFERCVNTERPKNVTQFCQFLSRRFYIKGILPKAKAYKQTYSDEHFKEIKQCLTNTL